MIWVSQYHEMRMANHAVVANGSNRIAAYEEKEEEMMVPQVNQVPVCLTQADTVASVTFFLLLVLLFFAAPFAILVVLYSFIVSHLTRDSSSTSATGDTYHSRAKRQVVLMLLTVVVSFFVCLSPYRLLIFYIVVTPAERIATVDSDTFFGLLNFSRIMFYLNSAGNPVLYNLMSSKFRRGFLRLCGLRREERAREAVAGSARRLATHQQQGNSHQEEDLL